MITCWIYSPTSACRKPSAFPWESYFVVTPHIFSIREISGPYPRSQQPLVRPLELNGDVEYGGNWATVRNFRNTGGFDMLGSGRDKIETKQQMEDSLKVTDCCGYAVDVSIDSGVCLQLLPLQDGRDDCGLRCWSSVVGCDLSMFSRLPLMAELCANESRIV